MWYSDSTLPVRSSLKTSDMATILHPSLQSILRKGLQQVDCEVSSRDVVFFGSAVIMCRFPFLPAVVGHRWEATGGTHARQAVIPATAIPAVPAIPPAVQDGYTINSVANAERE